MCTVVIQQWGSVLWTNDSRNLVDERQLPGEWYLSDCIVPYVKFYARDIMVRGCLSGVGLGPITPVKGTPCCGNSVGIAPSYSIWTAQQTVCKARSIKAWVALSCLKPFFNLPHWSAHIEHVQGNRTWCLNSSHVFRAPAGFDVSVKLCDFWWSNFRYYSVVTGLDQQSLCHIMQLQQVLPQVGKYSSSSYSRGAACLLWKEQTSYFLCSLNVIVWQWIFWIIYCGCWAQIKLDGFLFLHIFLHQIPSPVCTTPTKCLCLAAGDFQGSAKEAHWVILTSRCFSICVVASDSLQPAVGDVDYGWGFQPERIRWSVFFPPAFLLQAPVLCPCVHVPGAGKCQS